MKIKLTTTTEKLLAEILREIKRNQLPHTELWKADEIAQFLKLSKASVQSRTLRRPDFPRPVRIPSENGLGGKRWYAREVKAWLQKNRDPMRTR